MIKIGITGGIGSGKSTVCKVFSVIGIPVFNADEEARRLMQEDKNLVEKIKELFGEEAYLNEKLNRAKIAAMVFENKDLLQKLNALVHPAVGKEFIRWAAKQTDQPYVIKEAAILFESNAHKGLDYVIAVSAPEKLRIERIMQRDGVSAEQVKQRMKNQWPERKKVQLADFVVVNDDKKMVLPQVMRLHDIFMELSGGKNTEHE
jgi:dephospho-CoA kinase